MGALLDKTLNRIAEKSTFANPALKDLLTAYGQKSFALAEATVAIETKAVELALDPVTVTDELDGLAQQFGDAFPSLSADRTQKIKDFVHELIDENDADFEAKLEAYFDRVLDMEVSYNDTVSGVNNLIPGSEV